MIRLNNEKNIQFTQADRAIIASYMNLMDGLAEYLGSGFELVLHSLEDLDESVVKILNGHHTGRKVGAPVTDFALGILNKIQDENLHGHARYESKNKDGDDFHSTTILVHGEKNRLIGFLCINYRMDTPFSQTFPVFELLNTSISVSVKENFADDVDSLIETAVKEAKQVVENDDSILVSLRNKEIVAILHSRGIFHIKDSVMKVANILNVSKNTIYMHLRSFKHN